MRLKAAYALAALALVWLLFQVFFRYQYVRGGPLIIWRIDRLTGVSCRVDDCDYYWSLGPRKSQAVDFDSPSTAAPAWTFGTPQASTSAPPGFSTSSPPPSVPEIRRRTRADAITCVSAIQKNNYDLAANICGQAATDLSFAAYNPGPHGTPTDVASLLILSSGFKKSQSFALLKLGLDRNARAAFLDGKSSLQAVYVTPGCQWCRNAAKAALEGYGEWPPRSPHL